MDHYPKPFIPGRFSIGSIGASRTASGYSQTSLDFSISVLDNSECTGFSVILRLTGYGEHKSETQGCTYADLETLIKKVFVDMTEKSHSGTPYNSEHAEQIQIEKNLLNRLLSDLPRLIQNLF